MGMGAFHCPMSVLGEEDLQKFKTDLTVVLSAVMQIRPDTEFKTLDLITIRDKLIRLADRADRLSSGPGLDKSLWLLGCPPLSGKIHPPERILIVKAVRERTGMGLAEIRYLLEDLDKGMPRLLLDQEQVREEDVNFSQKLSELGAVIEWRYR